jgi:hypothetical protein
MLPLIILLSTIFPLAVFPKELLREKFSREELSGKVFSVEDPSWIYSIPPH